MADYIPTSEGTALCTKCKSYCTAYVHRGEVISDCCDAPAEWELDGEIIVPNDLWNLRD